MNLKEKIKGYSDIKAQIMKTISNDFGKDLQYLCQEIKGLARIKWTQYTPYFNDGESCEFSVNSVTFNFKGDEDGGDNNDGFLDIYDLKSSKNTELIKCKEIDDLITNNDIEDILYDMFGDHVEVIFDVKSGKFEPSDFSHD